MSRRPALLAIGLFTLAAACPHQMPVDMSAMPAFGRASDVDQVAQVLADVHRGMERRQIYRVLSHVSRSYSDSDGRSYATIQAELDELFRRYRRIDIHRTSPRIYVQGSYARAVETFGTTAEPFDAQTTPPINTQGSVTAHLERIGGRWMIVRWSD